MSLPLYKLLVTCPRQVYMLPHTKSSNAEPCTEEDLREAHRKLSYATAIDASDAVDFLRRHDVMTWSVGVCNASPIPFSCYWLEWRYRDGIKTGVLIETFPVGIDPDDEPVTLVRGVGAIEVKRSGRQGIAWGDVAFAYYVGTKTGKVYAKGLDNVGLELQNAAESSVGFPEEVARERIGALASTTIKMNWFMQVRNVTFAEIPTKPRERKYLRSSNPRAKIDFRRLVISQEVRKGTKPCPSGSHRDLPLHLVMGHFKCYDDKPLFGKLKGTFFWGAHTRGVAENGTVKKTYTAKGFD